jgi:hypothetical protein
MLDLFPGAAINPVLNLSKMNWFFDPIYITESRFNGYSSSGNNLKNTPLEFS